MLDNIISTSGRVQGDRWLKWMYALPNLLNCVKNKVYSSYYEKISPLHFLIFGLNSVIHFTLIGWWMAYDEYKFNNNNCFVEVVLWHFYLSDYLSCMADGVQICVQSYAECWCRQLFRCICSMSPNTKLRLHYVAISNKQFDSDNQSNRINLANKFATRLHFVQCHIVQYVCGHTCHGDNFSHVKASPFPPQMLCADAHSISHEPCMKYTRNPGHNAA